MRALPRSLFLCVLILVSCAERDAPTSRDDKELKLILSSDDSRIYFSIVNVSDRNFRWDPWPRAEQTGDLRIEFSRRGTVYGSGLLRSDPEAKAEGLIWIQSGDGIARSWRKPFLQERFELAAGCYEASVSVTNRAAVAMHDASRGSAGPIVEGRSEAMEVCFESAEAGND